MPPLIASLIGGLAGSMGSFVSRVLLSLGLSYVAYQGVDVLVDWIKVQAFDYLSQAGSISVVVTQIMGVLQIGTCVSIWFSAFAVFLGIKLSGGVVKKMVLK